MSAVFLSRCCRVPANPTIENGVEKEMTRICTACGAWPCELILQPQSDQSATTPGRAEELAAWLEECAYEEEDSAVKGREIATILRAQSAEMLALRPDKRRLDALDADFEIIVLTNCAGSERIKHNAFLNPEHKGTLRAEIDAAMALNSTTQGAK